MQGTFKQLSPRTLLAGTFIVFSGPFLMVLLFPSQLDRVMDRDSYVVFHNVAEFFSIMVSLSVFSVGWFTYDQSKDRHALFLSVAFLAVGLLDFMHTMSNAAMPDFFTPNSTNKSTQFWIAARLFDASAFAVSAFIYQHNRSRWLSDKILLASAVVVTGLVFTGVIFFPSYLPATAVQGVGLTPLKRYLELLVILLLAVAAVAYWKRMKLTEDRSLVYYLAAFIICIFSEGVFASYKTGFDTHNVLGHIYKVAAFYLIYKGVFIAAVKAPYEKLVNQERIRHLASFPQLNPNPILEVDSSGRVTFSNPATQSTLKMLGFTDADVDYLIPTDLNEILKNWNRKQDLTLQREIELKERVFGETIFLTPQFEVARIYAFDITERKRMEDALKESEQRVRRKLESILSPEGDISNLDLADVIDVRSLQSLVDDFYELIGIPMALIDIKGKVLVGVGWQDVCTKFHRVNPETCRNCVESDVQLSACVPHGEFKLYKCKNNMWDVATPILVGERHFGNLFMGQFFFEDEPLDYELFQSQARQYGFDEKEYLAALEAVPRLNRESLNTGMSFFMKLADILSQLSYGNIKLARSLTERDDLMDAARKNSARMNLLAETASELLASDSPQIVVDSLCQKVMTFLGCHAFFNFLVDEEQGRLRLNACAGIPVEEKQRIEWLDYGVAVCGCVARDACRIVAEDIPETPDPRTELVKSYGIRAYACHPLMARGRLLGTLSFGTRTRTTFSDEDLALMKVVADQVATAMERKRGDEALRRAHDELELRVRERTEELAEVVETLQGEMAVRESTEESLQRLNRLYAVLSETDQAIIRAHDRDSLFHDFCRIAVEDGCFKLAWVGLVDEESGQVRKVAASGATGYLDDVQIMVKDEPVGSGPTGMSIRTGTYHICNDYLNDPCTRPWHEKGLANGIRSSASVAVKEEGRVIGALTVYSVEKEFFDMPNVELLVQMGADVSFALDNLARDARRYEAEQALLEETLERLQAVEALREQERILLQQSRLAAMGEMLNNIAHQWRQPLNSLGLTIQQLGLFYDMGHFSKEFLDKNVDSSMKLIQHMSQTIEDFRNFSNPDKEKSEFKVKDKIRDALKLIDGALKNQGIAIEADLNDETQVFGYPNEYSQVVLNILTNAKDAFGEGVMENRKIVLTAANEGGKSVVLIRDNAGGIPDHLVGKIFDPYFSTKGSNGTGIGLFMAKNIVEKSMSGRLSVRNAYDGAEFRIEIKNHT